MVQPVEMKRGKIVFTGNFWEYFLISLGLGVLSLLTFGTLLPYWIYWSANYFFDRLEIEIPDISTDPL